MTLSAIRLEEAEQARVRIASIARRTPLVLLATDVGTAETHLKLENLQPIGSFKLRGAANAMAMAGRDRFANGVYTASAGNMAQGVAWCAREFGVRCQVVVPEHAPRAKTDAIARLGAETIRVPFAKWWQALVAHHYPGMDGLFVHPFADRDVMAGNGTIALELFDDLQHIDAVLVPFGGGGLLCGVASIVAAVSPATKVYAVECSTAAPLTASLAAGEPVPVTYTRTFVDGMGSAAVSAEMWPLVQSLVAGTIVVSLEQIAAAVRLLAERARVVAEGAGAAALAAAMSEQFHGQRVVCIVSGGNIDAHRLAAILQHQIPE
ncbi:MAG: pyridoxal-phosphate dependent enzyme [Gemmatimonas sp.]